MRLSKRDNETLATEGFTPTMIEDLSAVLRTPVKADIRDRPRFKEWTLDEMDQLPDTEWLIGDEDHPVLIAEGLWLVFGLFKGGKTYRAMEQAFCIAFGLPFNGLSVQQGNVAYVIAEGGAKRIFKRLEALCAKYKLDPAEALNSGKFNLITSAVNLADPAAKGAGVDEMLRALAHEPYAAVWLDTWARMLSASGGHDSDADTVLAAIAGCDRIREALSCTVTIVAHVGWNPNAQERPKGMVDLPGAIDGATFCVKEGEGDSAVFRFKSLFQRHAADGFEQYARLAEFAPDRALSNIAPTEYKVAGLDDDLQQCLSILRDLGDDISVDRWRDAVKSADLWPAIKNWRDKWRQAKKTLTTRRAIDISSGTVSIHESESDLGIS